MILTYIKEKELVNEFKREEIQQRYNITYLQHLKGRRQSFWLDCWTVFDST